MGRAAARAAGGAEPGLSSRGCAGSCSSPRSRLTAGVLGCGGGETADQAAGEPFDLALDFYVNPDHAGIFEGLERGYFEDAGLDVTPQVPSDPSAPIKQVAAGRVDLAISYEPEVMLARDQGLDVVAVGALVDGPLTSLISLPEAGIESAGRSGRQDRRHRRHPLPGGLPADDPRERRRRSRHRRSGRRRLQPDAAADRGPRRRDVRRLSQRRGGRPRRARPRSQGRPGRPPRGADLRRARPRRRRRPPARGPGADRRLPGRPRPRDARRRARSRRRHRRRSSTPATASTPS